ncbi:glycosyltransferase [Paenibacillus antri]|uniref:Glycosyltransferase n=1 Tax=Paenibacillus antri TaxID=2582848 RepID=A0A5R9G6F7_9BACL|nr:glycosyltransferase [Paenibacillus antri]TLS51972.1 glycosyltransferase [Paenibacillus antri]
MSRRHRKLSVVIPAQNEASSIGAVIREVRKLSPLEIIVVANGSTDGTAEACRELGCTVHEFKRALGNDIGRAVGAYYARGDALLFLDGDIPVRSEQLRPFVEAIENGHDIALNNLAWLNATGLPHYTTLAKKVFNRVMRRIDLAGNSLLAIPHAMSRKALETIGWKRLAAPVVAQAIAIERGLSIVMAGSVDVVHANKPRTMHIRRQGNSPFPESTERILGDHLEALHYAIRRFGPRAGLTDGARNRDFLRAYEAPDRPRKAKRSAIIPVGEERSTIQEVVREARRAGVDEIIVVANGADDETVDKAMRVGANVLAFRQRLGHNVGRAVGAAFSTGDVLLFIDGDFVVPANDLQAYIRAAEAGTDVALNDLTTLCYREGMPLDAVSAAKYILNCCLRRPELLNGSMTAVPHAVRRRVIDAIGFRSLMIPPLAQAKAIRGGFVVRNVHYTDVVTPNRIRPDHVLRNGTVPAFERIVGDHVEAIDYVLRMTDPRGGFFDGDRNRDIIERLGGERL